MPKNYYDTLGVNKSASADEIKKAFRKLAHQHHPDKQSGNEVKFKEINEAYQVLSDATKRQQYDQFGQTFEQAGRNGGGFGGGASGFDFNDFASAFNGQRGGGQNQSFDFGDLGDIFGGMFGGGQSRGGRSSRGSDISVALEIGFLEAVFGTEKTVTLEKNETCNHCHGNKAEPGTKIVTCSTCKGSGQVTRSVGFGMAFATPCNACQGQGSTAEKKCTKCHGAGYNRTQKTLTIKIPAGIDSGQMIKLSNEGNVGAASHHGDLYVEIRVSPDSRFNRDNFDIISEQKISFPRATLGGTVEVETVDGMVTLKIPEGTQSHQTFRLKGHGVPHLQRNGRGDHLVTVKVATPTRLSRSQKKLLEQLEGEFDS